MSAQVPDMPQGSLKKIEIELLLADLPLKLRDPALRLRQLIGWRRRRHCFAGGRDARRRLLPARRLHRQNLGLGRATPAAQRYRPAHPTRPPPLVHIPPPPPNPPPHRPTLPPRQHPPNRRNLVRAAESPLRLFAHQLPSTRRTVPLFPVSF